MQAYLLLGSIAVVSVPEATAAAAVAAVETEAVAALYHSGLSSLCLHGVVFGPVMRNLDTRDRYVGPHTEVRILQQIFGLFAMPLSALLCHAPFNAS